jgi:transcriptional regulator with XRE-family HTH domain
VAPRKIQKLAAIVGENISRRRKAMGMTQAELAEKLGIGGDSLSRFENGVVSPRIQRLEEIAEALDCAVADLFRKHSDPPSVKLDTVADMLSSLPQDAQDDVICLIMDVIRTIKKRL